MSFKISSVIVATGGYIPEKVVSNAQFLNHLFYEKNGERIKRDNSDIISKFKAITEIEERRYADDAYYGLRFRLFCGQRCFGLVGNGC